MIQMLQQTVNDGKLSKERSIWHAWLYSSGPFSRDMLNAFERVTGDDPEKDS